MQKSRLHFDSVFLKMDMIDYDRDVPGVDREKYFDAIRISTNYNSCTFRCALKMTNILYYNYTNV